jgi:hypothetical protein
MNLCVILALSQIFYTNPDSIIRGIYINPYQANNKNYLEKIFVKADSGLINAIVVDFKSDYGFLSYASNIELAQKIGAIKRYIDVDYLIKNAALHNLKLIARIVCFRDDYLSQYKKYAIFDDSGEIWTDKKGLAWTNPYKNEVRDYLLEITKEIVNLGIKSIAFDYIRFPTDGDVKRIRLTNVKGPRSTPIIEFLKKVRNKLGNEVEIGVCVFGFAVWYNLRTEGQDIEKMGEHIDILYPMLYPSHFHRNFKKEVNEYWRNYWIYFDSVKEAIKKSPLSTKITPFIQGFDLRAESFGGEYIFSQINGTLSGMADGFIIWNARCNYSTSWNALLWASNSILRRSVQMSLNTRMKEEGRRYQDKVLEQLLAQEKIQKKNLTMPQTDSLIDSLPLLKTRKIYPDPMIP